MSAVGLELGDELVAFLDLQSEHLGKMLGFLDAFRKALIRRDLPLLQEMQAQLSLEAETRMQLDQSRQNLQRKLAGLLGCPAEKVCLSLLHGFLDFSLQEKIRHRQKALTEQVRRLQDQHLATELLLRECARMNRRLLETVMGGDEKGKTYDARGRSSWSTGQGLMNVKL